mmetsp:Transcript_40413/g.114428  ORF Transcript_40413/g.114428 Transcript_40413/m.114428 type:complete len:303 (-) Transcript_40413:553-1461(-)
MRSSFATSFMPASRISGGGLAAFKRALRAAASLSSCPVRWAAASPSPSSSSSGPPSPSESPLPPTSLTEFARPSDRRAPVARAIASWIRLLTSTADNTARRSVVSARAEASRSAARAGGSDLSIPLRRSVAASTFFELLDLRRASWLFCWDANTLLRLCRRRSLMSFSCSTSSLSEGAVPLSASKEAPRLPPSLSLATTPSSCWTCTVYIPLSTWSTWPMRRRHTPSSRRSQAGSPLCLVLDTWTTRAAVPNGKRCRFPGAPVGVQLPVGGGSTSPALPWPEMSTATGVLTTGTAATSGRGR